MKNLLTATILLLFMSGNALAGSEYEKCISQEKALKMQESGDCSGLKYLLDPSGCFSTQKALKEYAAGKCKKIGMAEQVDSGAPMLLPEKKTSGSTSPDLNKRATGTPSRESTIEKLKEENARLAAEISRLTAENEQLRKAGR